MFLNQLNIFGFKSFPGKLDLKFGEGITGIVGPNGCGKTNIVDAIRWVLGEQKTTLLRSEQMEDVIFNGTANRKPLGMAEVSLTIDNTQNILPPDYSEVMITRRLFRSGESEYFINKSPCRRKDIVDLFLDTGMAPHAYSVIELSMVESILGGQADALRVLFEEAAGIAKYKMRRREALRKLEKTKENLLRVGDIVAEVEKQVRSLRQQAAKAQRHQRYREELSHHEMILAIRDWRQRDQESARLSQMLDEARGHAGEAQEQLRGKEAKGDHLRCQLLEKEQSWRDLSERISERGEQLHRLEEQILIGRERLQGLQAQGHRISSEIASLESKLDSLGQERQDRTRDAGQANDQQDAAQKILDQKEDFLAQLDEELLRQKATMEKARGQISQLLQERNEIRDRVEHAVSEETAAQRRREILGQELARIDGHLEDVDQDLRDTEDRLNGEKQAALQIQSQLDQAQRENQQAGAELAAAIEEHRTLQGRVEMSKNRLELFRGAMATFEGYQEGVQAVLKELPDLPGLYGTVAELIQPQERYLGAIEVALGEAAQHLVVQTAQTALQAIEHLRRQRAGRATFLMLDRIEGLPPAGRPEKALSQEGSLAWAPEVIACDLRYRPVVDFLLGQVVIVDGLASLVKKGFPQDQDHQICWVDLSGEVLHTPATIRGGHLAAGPGLFDRRQKVQQEESLLQDLSAQLEHKQIDRRQLESLAAECAERVTALQNSQHHHSVQRAGLEREVQTLGQQRQALRERRDILQGELGGQLSEYEDPTGNLAQMRVKISECEQSLAQERDTLRHLEEEVESLENKSRMALREVSQARVEMVTLQGRGQQLRLEADRLKQLEEELTASIESRRVEIQQIEQNAQALAAEIAEKETQVQERSAEQKEWATQEHALQEEATSIKAELAQLESEMKRDREARESVQQRIHDVELQLAEIHIKQQSVQERMLQDQGINLSEAQAPEDDGMDLGQRQTRIDFLRGRIAALGPVNLSALEEYNACQERYDFLIAQRQDLLAAEENLNGVIADLNRRARHQFNEIFQQVNENFQAIFKEMFEGGQANLILNGQGDFLEADIQIYACPGGKKLRHIAQLSGGEKALTAISLLFSLYQVKPSPFCVLDEVDAPLDDANIGRFVSMLKKLSERSQFIIITHNKNTMAAADILYGVTMEQSGVSKVVSVNLRQAEARHALSE